MIRSAVRRSAGWATRSPAAPRRNRLAESSGESRGAGYRGGAHLSSARHGRALSTTRSKRPSITRTRSGPPPASKARPAPPCGVHKFKARPLRGQPRLPGATAPPRRDTAAPPPCAAAARAAAPRLPYDPSTPHGSAHRRWRATHPATRCYRRSSGVNGCGCSGPTYSARGRMSRLFAYCSSTWAVQPAMRLTAKTGVNSSMGIPSRW